MQVELRWVGIGEGGIRLRGKKEVESVVQMAGIGGQLGCGVDT